MKARLYIIWFEQKWQVRATIAAHIDLHYWSNGGYWLAEKNSLQHSLQQRYTNSEQWQQVELQDQQFQHQTAKGSQPYFYEGDKSMLIVAEQSNRQIGLLMEREVPFGLAKRVIARWEQEQKQASSRRQGEQITSIKQMWSKLCLLIEQLRGEDETERKKKGQRDNEKHIALDLNKEMATQLWKETCRMASLVEGRLLLEGELRQLLESANESEAESKDRSNSSNGRGCVDEGRNKTENENTYESKYESRLEDENKNACEFGGVFGSRDEKHYFNGDQNSTAFTFASLLQLAELSGLLSLSSAVASEDGQRQSLRCQRCGSGSAYLRRTPCAACGAAGCAYCERCLTMGRSRECALLILGATPQQPDQGDSTARSEWFERSEHRRLERWGLSAAQYEAAREALRFIEGRIGERPSSLPKWSTALTWHWWRENIFRLKNTVHANRETDTDPSTITTETQNKSYKKSYNKFHKKHIDSARTNSALPTVNRQYLLWAVTGAGKTEMVFPLIETVLIQHGRVLLATPRRDVVLELAPRIGKAFPDYSVTVLYGGSEQRWQKGEITLATTHQLLRFRHAFDLVIIDELDAFPYHNDTMLHYAASLCGKPMATTVLLSATPPYEMQQLINRGKLPHAKVPVRFHGHPLPVPVCINSKTTKRLLEEGKLPSKLLHALRHSWNRGAQIFLFVQRIEQTEPFAKLIRKILKNNAIAAVSSKDTERAHKVEQFRQGHLRVLVTTTILERGVTIPKSDVYIMDADGQLFDEASLVQMAGRAGRAAHDPAGRVYFCASSFNQAQQRAIKQIKSMNKIAARKGLLNKKV